MTKTVHVSGCSFTENASWVNNLFENATTVINRAHSSAGNRYISDSIVLNIDLKNKPDFVFALFSGINRVDTVVPHSNIVKTAMRMGLNGSNMIGSNSAVIGTSAYIFSGGSHYNRLINDNYKNINHYGWPNVKSIEEFLNLSSEQKEACINNKLFWWNSNDIAGMIHIASMLQYLDNPEYLSDQTYISLERFQTFLNLHQIDYKFGFIHDPFDKKHHDHLGFLNKQSPRYHCIDWRKYVKINPYEFGIKHDFVAPDGFHICPEGMNKWADSIKQFF
jgi:hypothetical protein